VATLRPNGVVVATVVGANPAMATYRLRAAQVGPAPATAALPQTRPDPLEVAVAVMRPDLRVDVPPTPPYAIFEAVEAGAKADTARGKVVPVRLRTVEKLQEARRLIQEAQRRIESLDAASATPVCGGAMSPGGEVRFDPTSYWSTAQSAALLATQVRDAVRRVTPPVTQVSVDEAKDCIRSLRASPTWGTLLTQGPSTVARAYAESRGELADIVTQGTRLRDSLQTLAFPGQIWDAGTQQSLIADRNALTSGLNQILASAQRSLDSDFTSQNLESMVMALTNVARWSEIVLRSQPVATVEATVDGDRGRSRNLLLEWEPREGVPGVTPGQRTVLIDRFRGFLVNVSGGAGFTGTRVSEVLRRAAFGDKGQIIADSVDLLANRRVVWKPALSTGLAVTYHWTNGFHLGSGIEFAVIGDTEGGATTRIVLPVLHGGRDEMRVFVGPLLGRSDMFTFRDGDRIRIAKSAPDPENLIVRQKEGSWKTWPEFYLGIIVGQRSLNPSNLQR
jgi:hypothetical protein